MRDCDFSKLVTQMKISMPSICMAKVTKSSEFETLWDEQNKLYMVTLMSHLFQDFFFRKACVYKVNIRIYIYICHMSIYGGFNKKSTKKPQ